MPKNTLSQDLLNAMSFRCIGPPRGGRVVAVAGDPSNPAVFYHGAVAGGVFKTTDAGTTWFNVSDGFFKTSSVGALEVAPSSPNVIYAGMGESTIRTDVSYGDGVYKSTDAGRTWTHMGLANTRHIGRIVIHPTNPDLIYVAALGHAFGPNPERGVYRSSNGGATWDLVLHKSEIAGATDITLDAHNPGILYASIWQTRRGPWYLSSGGEDGGLWRSRDGGDTWTDISRAKGLPQSGLYGKIGVAASPVQPGRVWALVESQVDPGLYRSDDFGENWVLLSDSLDLRRRPWYYMHVVADTQHADTVYVSNLGFHRSTDGGKTFTEIPTPHGDNHALWIDPNDNRRMVQGNDGGACVSFNAGGSFSTIYNQLTAQIYNIDTDNLFPWSVYATQQDNGSIGVPTDAAAGVIPFTRCFEAGTGESGYIVVDPKDPMVGYVGAVGSSAGGLGALQRFSRHTDQVQLVNVWPQIYGGDMALKDFKHRFPWTFPILFSPHDPNTLYTCGERAFRSTDEGHSWTAFSPDLTRNDPAKQTPSGGPITLDSSAAEHYCTIFTFRESHHEPGVFWAGSDDGLVHLSRDGGKSWQNVTPPKLPEWAWIRTVEPSPHDHATCYIAATRYKLDDPAPYLYKTTDYGATWTAITSGIGEGDYTRVIRADPSLPGVLYAGTETGLYVSINDGQNWSRWSSNFPVTPVFDLKVRGTDLVIATHGRSLWLLDDLTPIHQAASHKAIAGQPRLFRPRTTLRILPDLYADWIPSEGRVYGVGTGSTATWIGEKTDLGHLRRKVLDAGEGAPRGAIVYYALPEDFAPETPISLAFHDGTGNVLREYCPKPAGWDKWDDKQKSVNPGPWISTRSGVNRFLWNLRLEGTVKVPGNKTAPELNEGPLALPGPVTVHLTVGDKVLESQFEVVNDPRVTIPVEVLADQQRLLLKIRDVVSEDYRAVVKLRDVREQVEGWRKRLADKADIVAAADGLLARLAAIEETLILPGEQKDTYHLTQRPRLNEAIASLVPVIGTADARPTEQAEALVEEYTAAIREQVAALESVLGGEIASLNQRIAQASSVAILV
jgi:photosystem II stability/assembly factor-like uncharacterized protein